MDFENFYQKFPGGELVVDNISFAEASQLFRDYRDQDDTGRITGKPSGPSVAIYRYLLDEARESYLTNPVGGLVKLTGHDGSVVAQFTLTELGATAQLAIDVQRAKELGDIVMEIFNGQEITSHSYPTMQENHLIKPGIAQTVEEIYGTL